ncbi:MAG: phosphatase PAP2 family protein [Solirubrobacteraceae bacterium]
MPGRARNALTGAAVGVVLLALTWYVSHHVAVAMRADVSILRGFAQLGRPWLDTLTNFVAGLCSPDRYVFLVAIVLIVALARRRPRVAAMIAVVVLGANETTQLLKPLLAAPRDLVYWHPIDAASWPSGHATAAMTLALCSIVAAPARRRPAVAAAMAAFAVAVCYSFLELGWHYPSDVLGGFLVAVIWTLLGIAVLTIVEARRAGAPARSRSIRRAGMAASIVQVLRPVAAMLAVVAVALGLILLARPQPVIDYASAHEAFVLGAGAIGVLGLLLSSGVTLMLRRG